MKNIYKVIVLTFFTLSSSLFIIKATNVSGGIYSNTTWTLNNSPYIVTDTVVVFPGVTLTIQPGVVVKFDDHKMLEIRQGKIIANGNSLDSITFTSNSNNPTPGIWNMIWLNNTGSDTSCIFTYCNFHYAVTGLGGNGYGYTTIINNSTFSHNNYGIASLMYTILDSSNFISNTAYGCSGLDISEINYCIFSNNQIGFFYPSNSRIDNCIFDLNQSGMNQPINCTFKNCSFNINQIGIGNSWGGNSFRNCVIDSNSVSGMNISNDSVINCQIQYNGIGLVVNNGDWITLNNVQFNNIGVKLNSNNCYIQCNKFCNDTSYDLYYTSTANSNSIINNYWCTTDSATIESHIFDGYDNISYGLLTFIPIDNLNCYLTGCNLQLSSSVTNATCDTCHNGSATVYPSNGFGPYTYTWNTAPIQTTQTAVNLAPGTYTVCVVDANGCTACQSVYVDSTNCTGYSITLHETNSTCSNCTDGSAWAVVSGGTAPYNYTWYTGPFQYTDTAINLLQGTYSVCVVDAYGCVVCDSITIGTGNCSANFQLYPDTTLIHHYWAVNQASGVPPLTYDWNWGDNSVHDFTANPSHTYANQGSYTICLTITDSVGCQNEFCQSFYLLHPKNLTPVTVNVVGSLMTGITQVNPSSQFSIYPNPNDGNFTLSYHSLSPNSQFLIKDVLGRTIYTHYIYSIEGKETIDVSGLNNGIYFYQFTNSSETMEGKFVIEK